MLWNFADGAQVTATHAELAARIGSAREVVSRQLERWADQGLIATQRGQITLAGPRAAGSHGLSDHVTDSLSAVAYCFKLIRHKGA